MADLWHLRVRYRSSDQVQKPDLPGSLYVMKVKSSMGRF